MNWMRAVASWTSGLFQQRGAIFDPEFFNNAGAAAAPAPAHGLRFEVARRSLQLQVRTENTKRFVEAGPAPRLDLTRSFEQASQFKANIQVLEAQRTNALYRLASLTGKPPSQYAKLVESCSDARERQREDDLATAQARAMEAEQEASRLFRGGKIDFLSLLDAQRTPRRTAHWPIRAQLATDEVAIFLALGGGWD